MGCLLGFPRGVRACRKSGAPDWPFFEHVTNARPSATHAAAAFFLAGRKQPPVFHVFSAFAVGWLLCPKLPLFSMLWRRKGKTFSRRNRHKTCFCFFFSAPQSWVLNDVSSCHQLVARLCTHNLFTVVYRTSHRVPAVLGGPFVLKQRARKERSSSSEGAGRSNESIGAHDMSHGFTP